MGWIPGDVDPSHRTIRIRAENTKTRRSRVVPYSPPTGDLLSAYLRRRREISSDQRLLDPRQNLSAIPGLGN